MSSNNKVNEFLQAVSQNEQLQQELMTALETAENDRQAAADIAKKYGYELSADEIGNEVARIQAEFTTISRVALSEAELESVAGGVTPTVKISLAAAGGAISGGVAARIAKW